jgi:hypothetical protein
LDLAGNMAEQRNSVSGAEAAAFKVIRTDSMSDAHKGTLVEADAMAGTFTFRDHVNGEAQHVNLGPHTIKIVRR